MNKSGLIDHIAIAADVSKATASRTVDALISAVARTLKNGEPLVVSGLGTFYVALRSARTGRNPRTGMAIDIKPAKVPKFRAGKRLKDMIN